MPKKRPRISVWAKIEHSVKTIQSLVRTKLTKHSYDIQKKHAYLIQKWLRQRSRNRWLLTCIKKNSKMV